MKIIALSHRIVITQARSFREYRLLQSKNYTGYPLSKLVQMWTDWMKIKEVLTTNPTRNGS